MSPRPPLLARLLLGLLPAPHRDVVAGDLEEEYVESVLPGRGRFRADLWFWAQVLGSLTAFVVPRRRSGGAAPSVPLAREVRHAATALRRQPGFTALAVLTLAVGIGATSSVYSVANWVLLRPVPGVEDPDGLVTITFESGTGNHTGTSLPNLRDLVAAAPALAGGAGHVATTLQFFVDGTDARRVRTDVVTAGYFELLGVEAALGRLFTSAEAEAADDPLVAVLGHDLWTSAFGGERDVLGRDVRVNGIPFTVVGVAPAGFRGAERLDDVDLWLPAAAYATLRRFPPSSGLSLASREAHFLMYAMGRLAPGATAEQAHRQVRVAMARLVEAHPDANAIHGEYRPRVDAGVGADPRTRSELSRSLRRLSAMVALVLAVACANVANLLLLRGVRRRGETAVRRALGASGGHLLLAALAESLLLALPAAALGVGIAAALDRVVWGSGFLWTGALEAVPLDARVVAFAVALSLATTALAATVPGLAAARLDVGGELKSSRRTLGGRGSLLQGGLTVVQLSLSLALMVAAVLVGRSVLNLSGVDVGFDAEDVVAYRFDPEPQGHSPAEVRRLHRDALEGVRALPGVRSATASAHPPMLGGTTRYRAGASGDPDPRRFVNMDWVAEGFFEVLRIPLLEGRSFTREEALPGADTTVAVVSRSLARALFGEGRAAGRRFALRTFTGIVSARVVGVVEDVRDWGPRRAPEPKVYLPLQVNRSGDVSLLVRAAAPPPGLDDAVRGALASVDPAVPFEGAEAMEGGVEQAMAEERTLLRLIGVVATLAAGLGAVGLYTVVAYAATLRRREFGIRIALGAGRGRILGSVLRHALSFGAVGALVGLAAALVAGRLLRGLLFGLGPMDPVALVGAVAALVVVTVAASLGPAVSATRVDPAEPMRAE